MIEKECKPTLVSVMWKVPRMNCNQEVFPYLTFQNQTRSVETEVEICLVEPRAVCESVNRTDCAQITVRNCSQVSQGR